MASIEKYQEFLSDIMSSSDISVENKKILYNVLNTSEMQAKIPNESLKDLSESIKASATSTKISPAAILAEVTTIQQKAQKFEQSREENREGTNNSQDQDFSAAAFSSFVSSQITEELLNNIRESYPEASEEVIYTIAAEQIADATIDKEASKEVREAMQEADSNIAFGKKGVEMSKQASARVFTTDQPIKKSDALKSFAEYYGDFANEISQKYDLTTEDGRKQAAQAYLSNGSYPYEMQEAIYAFLTDVEALYYQEPKQNLTATIDPNEFERNRSDASNEKPDIDYDTFQLQKKAFARKVKEEIIAESGREEGMNPPSEAHIHTYGNFRYRNHYQNDLDETLKEEENLATSLGEKSPESSRVRASLLTKAKNAKNLSDILQRTDTKQRNSSLTESNEELLEVVSESDVISQDDASVFFDLESEELPAEKETTPSKTAAQEASVSVINASDLNFINDYEEETVSVPQEVVEAAAGVSISEGAIEHDADAGLDALARGEKEVVQKVEEVAEQNEPKQDAPYNWRDVLRGFINRITGKTKAIDAPQKQQGQDESMPEPSKGNEVKKNDDSFFSRIAKALGMKKEEPQPIAPETEAKPEATIETSDVFSYVPVDVGKAVQETEAQAKANKEDPNLKKKLDDPTQEQ